jgi:NADH-quinone oxidoreductase subunit C
MDDILKSASQELKTRFSATINEFKGEVWVALPTEHIIEACRLLRDEFGFERLTDETAVDYWPQQKPRFHIIYYLYSYQHKTRIGLRVPLDGNAPSIPTLESVYPNANWYERELWDMFGIHFENHSDLRRILLPHDWEGHPLRKDYPLGYEEAEFSFNFEEIESRKPYAKE